MGCVKLFVQECFPAHRIEGTLSTRCDASGSLPDALQPAAQGGELRLQLDVIGYRDWYSGQLFVIEPEPNASLGLQADLVAASLATQVVIDVLRQYASLAPEDDVIRACDAFVRTIHGDAD